MRGAPLFGGGPGTGQRERAGGGGVCVRRLALDEPGGPQFQQRAEHGFLAPHGLREFERTFQGVLEVRGRVAVPRVERACQRFEDGEFLPLGTHELQRLLQQADRFGVREGGRRDFGRAPVVRDRALRPPAARVLLGELGRDRVEVA